MREQWLRRLLKNPLLDCEAVMEPVARRELQEAARNGQIVLLSMDQTDPGDRMAVLMVCLRIGDRLLPLAWIAEQRAASSSKKTQAQTDPDHWSFRKLNRSAVSRFKRGLRRLKRCLQNDLPLPAFWTVMRN